MKKRRRKSTVARVRRFWLPIGLFAAVVIAAVAFVVTWPGFDPKAIEVRGNHRVASSEILARASIAPHESIWLQNTHAMARRIEAIPDIATARVHRMPPASVTIAVSERTPYAVLRSGGDVAPLDHDLRVLAPEALDASWPVFALPFGPELSPGTYVRTREISLLRATYDTMAARGMPPRELTFDRFGGVVVTLRGGRQLLLGNEEDLGEKLTLAKAILAQVVGSQRRVRAIDLRAPGAPVLVY